MEKYIKLLIYGGATGVAAKLNIYLNSKIGLTLSVVFSSFTAAFLVNFLEYFIFHFSKKSYFGRRILDGRSKYEGYWILDVKDIKDRPVSLAKVVYNKNSEDYHFNGSAFDVNGEKKANWTSEEVIIDLGKNELRYTFTGTIYGEKNEKREGWGKIKFEEDPANGCTRGTGTFIDSGTDIKQSVCFSEKYSKLNIKTLIGKSGIMRSVDETELIKKYLALNGKK